MICLISHLFKVLFFFSLALEKKHAEENKEGRDLRGPERASVTIGFLV